MENNLALQYYSKLYVELTIWEQRHIHCIMDASMS